VVENAGMEKAGVSRYMESQTKNKQSSCDMQADRRMPPK